MSKARLTSSDERTASGHAPISHYMLAIAFGALGTLAVALIVAATNPDAFWMAAGIGALCAGYPAFSLGVRIFVSNNTVTRDAHGEESVEIAWMKQAASGAFLDTLLATIIFAVALMIWPLAVEALPALLLVIGVSAADAAVRYLVIRHRALK